jgi:hypothetical protein
MWAFWFCKRLGNEFALVYLLPHRRKKYRRITWGDMRKKLIIDYVKHPILAFYWCKLFGHLFKNTTWDGGGRELCERCTKYRDSRFGYWAYKNRTRV